MTGAVQDAAGAARPALPRARPSDLWNPILVKEVRQALRGRVFRITFLGTLAMAILAAFSNTFDVDWATGQFDAAEYFVSIYFCLVVALVGVVPFGAFQSMGAEWDESTYDLLELSNLRPRRIVIGKLQSALVQGLLFASAFVPFLTLAVLMPGIDIVAGAAILAWTVAASVLATMLAIALSTLTRNRFLRVVLMVGQAGLTAGAIPALMAISVEVMRDPAEIRSTEALLSLGALGVFACVAGGYLFALACNMLAHPEENRSTNVRLVTTVGSLLVLGSLSAVAKYVPDPEFVAAMAAAGISVVSVAGLFFVTERRALGRRVKRFVPRSRVVALAAAPWMPGGGRGVVLHVLHVGLIVLWAVVASAEHRALSAHPLAHGLGVVLLIALLSVVYVCFLPGLLAPLCERPARRLVLRVLVPVIASLSILLPMFYGAMVGDRLVMQGEHVLNPFRLLDRVWHQNGMPPREALTFVVAALVALLVNAPRLVAAAMETLSASADNERLAAARLGRDQRPEAADAGARA